MKLDNAVIIVIGPEQTHESLDAERAGFLKKGIPIIEISATMITLWLPNESHPHGKIFHSHANHLSLIVPLRELERTLNDAPQTATA